jgi:phenylacetic acid degradation operon negative regulatory protein
MKQLTTTEWIAHFMSTDPPRAKSLVMTVFGDTVAVHGGGTWLGSLIELLAPFGVNDRLLRTSVFRLVQEGWLVSSRDGRRSNYAILPSSRARFERANRRIYAPIDTPWDGNWTLLFAGANGIEAPEKVLLKKELLWEGFAQLAPGLFGHPGAHGPLLEELLSRTKLRERLFVCQARELPGVPARPLRELVRECWDLSEVTQRYDNFCEQFRPLLALLENGPALSAPQAFMVRTLLIHAYRRVQLHDPMLPVTLLPDPWPGSRAYALAQAIYRLTAGPSEEHVMTLLRQEDRDAKRANEEFFARFGGLRRPGE